VYISVRLSYARNASKLMTVGSRGFHGQIARDSGFSRLTEREFQVKSSQLADGVWPSFI